MDIKETVARINSHLEMPGNAGFIEACRIVAGIDDDAEYSAVIDRFPGLKNYDASGNWIGSATHENGWME